MESGGGFGRFFSGLGNILRLSSGSQVKNHSNDATSSDDDDEIIPIEGTIATTNEGDSENGEESVGVENEIAPLQEQEEEYETDPTLPENEYTDVKYHGQLITDMKFQELKNALKGEGCTARTKIECVDMLTEIAVSLNRTGNNRQETESSAPIGTGKHTSKSKDTNGTPAKGLKFVEKSLLSDNKMSTRRSVNTVVLAAAPPSSRLRHREAPTSSSDLPAKKTGKGGKTPSKTPSKTPGKTPGKTPSKTPKSDGRRAVYSHLFGDEYELSGTAATGGGAGGKRKTPSLKSDGKKGSVKKQKMDSVGLDEIRIGGQGEDKGDDDEESGMDLEELEDLEDIEEMEESEAESHVEVKVTSPMTRPVLSRADYQLKVAATQLIAKEEEEREREEEDREEKRQIQEQADKKRQTEANKINVDATDSKMDDQMEEEVEEEIEVNMDEEEVEEMNDNENNVEDNDGSNDVNDNSEGNEDNNEEEKTKDTIDNIKDEEKEEEDEESPMDLPYIPDPRPSSRDLGPDSRPRDLGPDSRQSKEVEIVTSDHEKSDKDPYKDGSGDDSYTDSDFNAGRVLRGEGGGDDGDDGGEADGEDEEEEDEEEIYEEVKGTAPYDEVAEGDDEYENTNGEEGEGEDEGEEEVEEEGEEEGEEEEEENEQEGEEVEEDDENEEKDYGDDDEVPLSEEEESEEDEDEDEESTAPFPSINQQRASFAQQDSGGIVDLVSSDEEEKDEEEENNDSFLTADDSVAPPPSSTTATAAVAAVAAAVSNRSTEVISVTQEDKEDKGNKEDKMDVTQDAVNTVLSAFKSKLSAKDFEQLQLIMGRQEVAAQGQGQGLQSINDLKGEESSMINENGRSNERSNEREGKRNDNDKENSRLSFEGGSWTSRESFLPPSPHDRFANTNTNTTFKTTANSAASAYNALPAPSGQYASSAQSNPVVFNTSTSQVPVAMDLPASSASSILSAQRVQSNIDALSQMHESQCKYGNNNNNGNRGNGNGGNNVKFNLQGLSPLEDRRDDRREMERERSSITPNGGSSSHIRYGPVTFMRRPMTPFARKTTPSPSPSPFHTQQYNQQNQHNNQHNNVYEGASSSALFQGQGQTKGGYNSGSSRQSIGEEEQQRKRRLEDSNYSDIGTVEQSDAKRMRSYDGSRQAPTPQSEYRPQIGNPGFTPGPGSFHSGVMGPGSGMSGPGSTYTPLFRDSSSRGSFSSILLQPSQRGVGARRASLSFSQRRKFSRQSEGGIGAGGGDGQTSSALSLSSSMSSKGSNVSSSQSAYASASVAKRILDALSELHTPIEEARQRPININAALNASKDALLMSERAPISSVMRPTSSTAAGVSAGGGGDRGDRNDRGDNKGDEKKNVSSYMSFPSFSSVGPAAVAASVSAKANTAIPTASNISGNNAGNVSAPYSFTTSASQDKSQSSGYAGFNTNINTNNNANINANINANYVKTPTAEIKPIPITKKNAVRFADIDAEFTFEEPSEVDGVDNNEMEGLINSDNNDNRIKFAFSPPGKSSKKRSSEGVVDGYSSLKRGCAPAAQADKSPAASFSFGDKTAPISTPTPSFAPASSTPTTTSTSIAAAPGPMKNNLWAMAASSDAIKCPSCMTSNPKGTKVCASCESALGGAANTSANANTTSGAGGMGGVSGKAVTEAPKGNLWAMAAASDAIKCPSCMTSNPKGTLKCASCESSLGPSNTPATAPTTTSASSFSTSGSGSIGSIGFTFGAPPASTPSVSTAPVSFGSMPSTGGFSFGAPPVTIATVVTGGAAAPPSAYAKFEGFSFGAAPAIAPAASAPGGVSVAPVKAISFGAPPTSTTTAAAPSSSFGGFTMPGSDDKVKPITFGSTPTPSVPPATGGFAGFGSVNSATTPTVPAAAPFSFGAPAGVSFGSSSTPSSTPSFGAPAISPIPAVAKVASAPFAFGSVPSAAATAAPVTPALAVPAFSFGAPKAATTGTTGTTGAAPSAAFTFGAAAPAVAPVVAAGGFTAGPAFTFGAPASSSAAPAAVPFTFGASTASNTGSAAPFMFGATSAAPATTPTFGGLGGNSAVAGHAHTVHGMDSPNSTMDTGYTSSDASNMGYPSATLQIPPAFGNGTAPFAFGAPAAAPMSAAMGTGLPSFGASQAPFGSGSSFGGQSGQSGQSSSFTFGAPQGQPQAQPAFGSGPGIAGGAFGQQQSMAQAAFSFGAPQAQPQQGIGFGGQMGMGAGAGMGSGMGMGMAQPPSGGGGGFSMGASDSTNAMAMRKKVKAKRPGGQ